MPPPNTSFDWKVYSDATFAGLSVLIPIPIIDWIFEEYFRRRMLSSIADYRGYNLSHSVRARINAGERSTMAGCLTFPITALVFLIKRISKKLLYFLTIKEASDKLSRYWHRAFLMDYMLSAGHLKDEQSARIAHRALISVLDTTTKSPLLRLAQLVTSNTRKLFAVTLYAFFGGKKEGIEEEKSFLKQHWPDVEGYLRELAERYETTHEVARRQGL